MMRTSDAIPLDRTIIAIATSWQARFKAEKGQGRPVKRSYFYFSLLRKN